MKRRILLIVEIVLLLMVIAGMIFILHDKINRNPSERKRAVQVEDMEIKPEETAADSGKISAGADHEELIDAEKLYDYNYHYTHNATKESDKQYNERGESYILPAVKVSGGQKYVYQNLYAYFCVIVYEDGSQEALSEQTDIALHGEFIPKSDGILLITVSSHADGYSVKRENAGMLSMAQGSNEVSMYLEGPENTDLQASENVIKVSLDGTGDYTSVYQAMSSITDSSEQHPVTVRIGPGTYDLYEELGGAEFLESVRKGGRKRQGIVIPDYVRVIGVGKVILLFEPSDEISDEITTAAVSALEIFGEVLLENLEIRVRNARYAVHDEAGDDLAYAMKRHVYRNCRFVHEGNIEGGWISSAAYAAGASDGCIYEFDNCTFISNSFYGWSLHNRGGQNNGVTVIHDGSVVEGNYEGYSAKCSYYQNNTEESLLILKNVISSLPWIICQEKPSVESDNIWRVENFTDVKVEVL